MHQDNKVTALEPNDGTGLRANVICILEDARRDNLELVVIGWKKSDTEAVHSYWSGNTMQLVGLCQAMQQWIVRAMQQSELVEYDELDD